MGKFPKSSKLDHVYYDIRSPVHEEALQLEEEGHQILKLNIGNPAPFGSETSDEILVGIIHNLPTSQGYCDSKGLYSARKVVVHHYQTKSLRDITVDDVYIGNGMSELITMSMQALLNDGDEILIPAPSYPLWTIAAALANGTVCHYLCDEENDWFPNLADMEVRITPKTKAIVVINSNNPTGAAYSKEILLEIAGLVRKHGLIISANKIYDKTLYDGAIHHHTAALAPDPLTIIFNGLSKTYRVAGFRQGWMLLSGPKEHAKGYIEGLDILALMCLCTTTPMQHTIQMALDGYQSINELILPSGRLLEQHNRAWEMVNQIPDVSCVKPMDALYMFPKIDTEIYGIRDDMKFIYDLLVRERVLLAWGSGFNWVRPDHFHIVTLSHIYQTEETMDKPGRFLRSYRR